MSGKRSRRSLDDAADDDSHPPPSKKQARGGTTASLLSFSDDVLVLILSHLTCCGDLLRLAETCRRLARICGDKSLWLNVDTRGGNAPLTLRELRKVLPFLHEKTKSVTVQGFLRSQHGNRTRESISPSFLQAISQRCPSLEELALEECYLDASKVTIDLFPSSLHVLRMIRCEVINLPDKVSYFSSLQSRIPQLRSLDLSGGGWVNNHSLMAMCKCEELSELNLSGCFRIGECFAYTALAARFGFRKLKKVDLRDTSAGDSEVPCFGRLPEITHLFLGRTAADGEEGDDDDERISDRGLLSLVAFSGDKHVSKLECLSLTHTRVTDAILSKLAGSLPLKSLDVSSTKVTEAGVAAVKKVRPDCEVLWGSHSAKQKSS